tara:strand:+ start:166 stop:555 length:390 start_codon:yes stop_codon:yes gene_type:complete
MFQLTAIYLTSAILGVMLFFSFVVAPVTFTALNEENARKFIRKIFPYYYNVNLVISILITLIFVFIKSFHLDFFLILSVTLLFALSNYVLMPLINKFRDSNQDKNFKISHFVSVVINFLQMILLIIILI